MMHNTSSPNYLPVPITDPHLLAYRDALAALYLNGQVLLAGFQPVTAAPPVWLALHDPVPAGRALLAFLCSTGVQAANPELSMFDPDRPPEYSLLGPFELEGTLAEILMEGGAYRRCQDPTAARSLGIEFVDALASGERMAVRTYFTRRSWSDWFIGGPWDRTIVAVDATSGLWTLLLATDTD